MPNRVVREGILDSAKVNLLSWAAEVFYRRLMSVVDDFGRYDAREDLLRSRLFPVRIDKVSISDVGKWLDECSKAGLVKLYSVNQKPYLEITDFNQTVRIKQSKYPAPDFICKQMLSEKNPNQTEKNTNAQKIVYDLKYFSGIGYEWELTDKVKEQLNKFLLYRNNHQTHGPVKSVEQVEAIIWEFTQRKVTDDNVELIVYTTMSKGAKNIIYDTTNQFSKPVDNTGSTFKSKAI